MTIMEYKVKVFLNTEFEVEASSMEEAEAVAWPQVYENAIEHGFEIEVEEMDKDLRDKFNYYFEIVYNALKKKNYIDFIEIMNNPDLKYGLYYITRCYHIGYSFAEYGLCNMVMLMNGSNSKYLNYHDLQKIGIDRKEYEQCFCEFKKVGIPIVTVSVQEKKNEFAGEFGWLSPTGVFTPSPFGTHEQTASEITEKKHLATDFRLWIRKPKKEEQIFMSLYRDFLIHEKGYCLIHNPSSNGGYIVTNHKKLTKAQNEFLFGYFMDLGYALKAERFIEK